MKLKGDWDSGTPYDPGDVVRYKGDFFHLIQACPTGITPYSFMYWSPLNQTIAACAELIMNAIDIANSDDPTNISENAIVLNSSTEHSDKQFIITVDDDGELTATELTEEDDT